MNTSHLCLVDCMSRKSAFSLIELLTVTAIILILVVIALPSFIESKTASQLSLARIRLTAMKAAVNYHLEDWGSVPADFNDPEILISKYRGKYAIFGYYVCSYAANPPRSKGGLQFVGDREGNIGTKQRVFYAPNMHCPLTSPVRYVSDNETMDPFSDGTIPLGYDSYPVDTTTTLRYRIDYGMVASAGPDKIAGHWNRSWTSMKGCPRGDYPDMALPYSPTNGSKSCGELWTVVSACSPTISETTCWADEHYSTRDHFGPEFSPQDVDDDGVGNAIEAQAVNGGDGNVDGISDASQSNVVSFMAAKGDTSVTLTAPAGTLFSGVSAVTVESLAGVPTSLDFPIGLFGFQVEGVPAKGKCDVFVHPATGLDWESYYRYGPTPESATAEWYSFVFDGTTGVEINGATMTLHFLDGERGDDDLADDLNIIDMGGPTGVGAASVPDWRLYD